MKKMTFMACAALLASAIAFTGCQGDQNEPKQNAPSVSTDIAISLPGQVGSNARHMPGRTVQTVGPTDFASNGMAEINLIPFAPKAKVSTTSVRYGANIGLANLDGSVALANANRAKVYTDKQVPQGTSAFLFYGKSGASGDPFNIGQLNGSFASGNPSTFKFELQPICSNTADVQTVADLFNAYLNGVIGAQDENSVAWKDYTAVLNEGYKDMFDTLKTLNVLNTYGIERMMTDLYHALDVNIDSLAKAIRKAILNPTYASLEGTGATAKVKLVDGMQNFPAKFKIPVGAISVVYSGGAFGSNAAHAYGGLAPANIGMYVYPAQLWYYANTQIKTSSASKADKYADGTTWKAILEQYENNNATVNASTRSIALIDTIQYGVARFDVQVKIATGDILDNNPVAGLRTVTIPTGGYPLKAVLIGNQKNVGFDFTQATYAGSNTGEYVIYDTVMTPTVATPSSTIAAVQSASDYSAANSTLVLETPVDDGANGKDVYVALEFLNTGDDFYGIDHQMIPAGARFYLVGKLAASAADETDYKVFKQDYTTTARFSINNLTKAYNTIPDLKAKQLEIGMSVDLYWTAGHTYDITLE